MLACEESSEAQALLTSVLLFVCCGLFALQGPWGGVVRFVSGGDPNVSPSVFPSLVPTCRISSSFGLIEF